MRGISLALLMSGLGLLASVAPSKAEVTYPWCAEYNNDHGGKNCGFATLEQCRATVSGIGGFCERNPLFVALPAARRPAR
jgi:Protein of unknown function (DUF3551)